MADEKINEYRSSNVIDATAKFGGAPPPGGPLQPPGGGGTFDDMEPRVAALEANVGHIMKDVADLKGIARDVEKTSADIRVNVATLTERVNNLPTKFFIVSLVSGGVAFTISILTLLSRLGWLVAGAAK